LARPGRFIARIAVALAIPATLAFSPAHTGQAEGWQPQMVAAVHTAEPAQLHEHSAPTALATIPSGSRAGALAVRAALTRLGDPYVWAAAGPHAFDCSGLVVWSFEQAGLQLPHSSQLLADGGRPVSRRQIQIGDVITYYSDASHVALYVGNGKIVHASTYGVPVAVVAMDNAPIYNIRRYT